MTKMRYIIPAAALSIALLAACSKEDRFYSTPMDGDYDYVTVGIDVSTGALTPMTVDSAPATKSAQTDDIICETAFPEANISVETKATGIDDPADATQTIIKNLWVLQYDGTGNTARLIGNPVYIEDYTTVGNRTAKLVASTTPNTIVFLANTFDRTIPFQQNSTIAELKNRLFKTISQSTILSIDPNTRTTGLVAFPNDGDYYQRLNGYTEQTITEGGNLTCTLAHNACRINVNIKNNTAGQSNPVTLISADIENVPGCIYFFTNYSGYTSGNNVGKPINHSNFTNFGLVDFQDVIVWESGEGTSTATKSAILYLSSNESGTISGNTNPKLKSLFSPSSATVLRIYGTYNDGERDIPVKYSFALGEDMIANYQLVPNGDYVYNITINARGDKTSDGRVSYLNSNGVDYTQTSWPLSNCYICNPPAVASRSHIYKIPVARVDQFWGGGNYENEPNNCLSVSNSWTVSVIWSDMPITSDNFVFTKATGTGKNDYFEVSIPGTTARGNVVIGIKNNLSTDWLWSWHLWVTDYCPDDAKYLTQQGAFLSGTDTYHITGGDVYRYQDAASGAVQKVHMDRTIGAMSKEYIGQGKGMLYYQYGRKDPFPGDATYWDGGTVERNDGFIINTTSTKKNIIAFSDINSSPRNVPYGVTHPTTFITSSGNWTHMDIYNPETYSGTIIWYDPYSTTNGGKSIFDPSPSGWKVPSSFYGLSKVSFSGGMVQIKSSLVQDGAANISYVAAGRRTSSGTLYDGGTFGYYWRSETASASASWLLRFSKNEFQPAANSEGAHSSGLSVCPVQE